MGRSVSVPSGAVATVYLNVRELDPDYEWGEFVDSLRDNVIRHYPSFYDASYWLDREDHAILENYYAMVVVSEYMGLVSVSLVPKDHDPKSESWCRVNAPRWRERLHKAYGSMALRKIGTMSNGESVYEWVREPDPKEKAGN